MEVFGRLLLLSQFLFWARRPIFWARRPRLLLLPQFLFWARPPIFLGPASPSKISLRALWPPHMGPHWPPQSIDFMRLPGAIRLTIDRRAQI